MDKDETMETSAGSVQHNKGYTGEQARSVEQESNSKGEMRSSSPGLILSGNGGSVVENIELLVTESSSDPQLSEPDSLFFRDGVRKIDFVLVYLEEHYNDGKETRSVIRKIYQDNLVKHGLELEEEVSLKNDCLHFIKVHAPLEVLFKLAEELMIRMPVKKSDNSPDMSPQESRKQNIFQNLLSWWKSVDPFVDKVPCIEAMPKVVTATFSYNNRELFESKNGNLFFDNVDRSRMVYRLLQMTPFGNHENDYGIVSLCNDEIYDACFPLHDGSSVIKEHQTDNDRCKLRTDWSSFRKMFRYQPINAVRKYFGGRIGLYYAWLGVYIAMLVPAAIVGVLCFLYGLATMESFIPSQEICDKSNEKLFYMCPQCDKHCSYWSLTSSCSYSKVTHLFDNEATVFFSVFMSIWATLFLEVWKRTQVQLGYEWGVYNLLEECELPRPQFLLSVRRKRPNPVTEKLEPYIPRLTRFKRTLGGLGVIFFMASVVVASIAGIVAYRASILAALYASSKYDIRKNAKLVTSFSAAIMNLVFIKILSFIYVKLAVMLTNWENPRTKFQYQNALTFKMYVFEFVNTYSSLFYIAFFKSSLIIGTPARHNRMQGRRIEGCDPSGCLTDVCIQLAVIMIGKQFLGFVLEFVYPSVVRTWNKWRHKPTEDNKKLPQWESDYLLNPEPDFRMFYEYLEMVIQFGFVTMFVASFPLAPLFALVNNIVELRADATNFVVNYRRPVGEEVKNIGIWFKILEILTKISVLVNSFVIAFTTELIPRLVYYYGYSADRSLRGYVNNSLTYISISDLEQSSLPDDPHKNLNYTLPYCRFKEYLENDPPYDYSKQYLHVTLARVLFVIFFQYIAFFVKDLLAWLVPDVPKSLEVKIKRENHVARVCLRKSEVEATRETSWDMSPPFQSCESLFPATVIPANHTAQC